MNVTKRLFIKWFVAHFLVLLVVSGQALAIQQDPENPLETPPTHWDEQRAWEVTGNVVTDMRNGAVQTVSGLREGPYSVKLEDAAWDFLKAHSDWLRFEPKESNLQIARTAESPGGFHVTFERVIHGVRVYPGNVVISFDRDMYARFFFSSIYVFDDRVSTTPAISKDMAIQVTNAYLEPLTEPVFGPEASLVIWAGDNRDFSLCWRVIVNYAEKSYARGDWEIMVDASSGQVRRAKNTAEGDATGYVFDPNPIVTSGMPYGSPGLSDNDDANSTELSNERISRTLPDVSFFIAYPGFEWYELSGDFCRIVDIESPNYSPPYPSNDIFNYSRDQYDFEAVMCYYHIENSHYWLDSLGFGSILNFPIEVDPHAEDFACNSHHHNNGDYLTFGDGTDEVDAAEDADIILHEYGHGINHSITPDWGGGEEGALGEGWGDYWANSYSRSVSSYGGDLVGNWGLQTCFGGRSMVANKHYPEDVAGESHADGQIWSQALHDGESDIGRTSMNSDVLQSYYYYGSGASMLTAALALIDADQALYGGVHLGPISASLLARGLLDLPDNDVCRGFTITSLPFDTVGTTVGASNDYDHTCASPNSPDVVYTLAPLTCPTQVVVSLCGSSFDTAVEIRTDGSCPGSTVVGCNNDFAGCSPQSRAAFAAEPNIPYYILIYGTGTNAGNYVLSVDGTPGVPVPSNDHCANATVIPSFPYTDSGNTCAATSDFDKCVGQNSPDVFYRYASPDCQHITVSLCGSDYDTAIEIRTGGPCPGNTLVACNDNFCGLQSQAAFDAAANQTYFIVVHGYVTGSRGAYTLNVVTGGAFVPPNDTCPGKTIVSLPYSDNGNTSCAENDYPNCAGVLSPDVVYNYTPQACGTVTASLCGSEYDTGIEIRAGGPCPGNIQIACNDNSCDFQSEASFFAESGVRYYFIVHGHANSAGPFTLNVTGTIGGVRSNDHCPGATAITQLPYTDVGSTRCAHNDRPNCVGVDSKDLFYSLNLEACEVVTVSLCGSDFDTGLEIRTGGSSCPGTTLVACNDNFCDLQSRATFTALAGIDYWFVVHGQNMEAGPFVLNVTGTACAPESLVVTRVNNDINLRWAPVGPQGSVIYSVYRSANSSILPVPANLIGTTTNGFYSDADAMLNPGLRYYYVVTASTEPLQMNARKDAPAATQSSNSLRVLPTAKSDF